MPYRNITWIKLEKRLLNDYRFFTLSEQGQLYYVKLLLLCAETNNRIPRKYPILKTLLRTECKESDLTKIIEDIRQSFPKILAHKDFYYIKGFKQKHNWLLPRNSQGTPKEHVDKIRTDKIRIDKIIEEYIRLRKWENLVKDNKEMLSSIYKRNCKPAKELLIILNNDKDKAIEVMGKLAQNFNEKGLTWTIETVIKHLPDVLSNRLGATPKAKSQENFNIDKELEQTLGKMATKDQIVKFLKKTPRQYWGKAKTFLCKRYQDGQLSYYNAERETVEKMK